MKRQKILILAMLMFALNASAQNNATLVLHHADGTTTDVALYLKPRVVFDGDLVRITSTVLDMEYPKSNILRFSYTGKGSSISNPQSEASFTRDGDHLIFHGIRSTDKVAVYNSDGIRVPVQLSAASDGVTLSISSIPKGVYVLSVNGKTSKFTKR